MNCPKCSQPMKEYFGLSEKGWDCVNNECGKAAPPEYAIYDWHVGDSYVNDLANDIQKRLEESAKQFIGSKTDDAVKDAIAKMSAQLWNDLVGTATAEKLQGLTKDVESHDEMRYIDESEEDFQFRLDAENDK